MVCFTVWVQEVPHKINWRRRRKAKQNKKTPKANERKISAYNCFLQLGEYQNVPKQKLRRIPNTEKRLSIYFSAMANRKRCLKKGIKAHGEQQKVPFFFLSTTTANRKRGLQKTFNLRRWKKVLEKKNRLRRKKRRATIFFACGEKKVARKNRVLRKTAILTQMLRPRHSATAN